MNSPNYRTIVAGIDYSETGLLALQRALNLASGTLHVVHVVEPFAAMAVPAGPVLVPAEQTTEQAATTLRQYVEGHLAKAWEGQDRPTVGVVVSHVALGVPAEQIVQIASDLDADLIVVGTHGRRGVKRFMLGSIAERVVRLATCPVLVVRPKALHATAQVAAPDIPNVEPPCPRCADVRQATEGHELWCEQHRERHGRRHTYHSRETPSAFPSNHGGLGSLT
jgi:nucleotide-binding universal stress UspA family protein